MLPFDEKISSNLKSLGKCANFDLFVFSVRCADRIATASSEPQVGDHLHHLAGNSNQSHTAGNSNHNGMIPPPVIAPAGAMATPGPGSDSGLSGLDQPDTKIAR